MVGWPAGGPLASFLVLHSACTAPKHGPGSSQACCARVLLPALPFSPPPTHCPSLPWHALAAGKYLARQTLVLRGVVPMLAAPMSEGSGALRSGQPWFGQMLCSFLRTLHFRQPAQATSLQSCVVEAQALNPARLAPLHYTPPAPALIPPHTRSPCRGPDQRGHRLCRPAGPGGPQPVRCVPQERARLHDGQGGAGLFGDDM